MTFKFLNAEWPAPDCIVAGTTTIQGGCSIEPYGSFNLASHVGDDICNVESNRKLLVSELNLPHEPHWLIQVHGTNVIEFSGINNSGNEENCSDAAISFDMNEVCAVLTADCVPLLVTDTNGSCVAAIHAGWRGLRDGIIEKTISRLNCSASKILVWIGPAISSAVFEVDDAVREQFVTIDDAAKSAYTQSRPGHWMMDLVLLAKQRIINCGVNSDAIFGGNHCSYLNDELFYSYRRHKITGRMASLIYIRNT